MPGSAKRFEDLVAWQRARQLTKVVYRLTAKRELAGDAALVWQMRRSAVSVMANVAEGFERESPRDFARFLLIARASCAELKSHIYVALDAGFISQAEFAAAADEAARAAQVISRLHSVVAARGEARSRR